MRILAAIAFVALISFTSTQQCPDPSYQVNLLRTRGKTNNYIPANMQAELAPKELGFRVDDQFSAGCIIQNDKLDVFKEKCPDWNGSCLAPLCYVTYTETNGNPQYRLRPGTMPDNCPSSSLVGYVIIKYDCCDAVAPLRELYAGNPDWWYDIDDKVYNGWIAQGIPFFTWPAAVKPRVCPDRTYMVPIGRTYSSEAKHKNNYFFLMDDLSDWERQQQAADYRLEQLSLMGCAIRKDRLDELEFACPKYKKCVKPLCSARWKDSKTGITVFRLEPGDWEAPFCGEYPHIGFIATTPGCCEANTLMYTLIRNKGPLPGYHHAVVADEVAGAIKGEWSIESQHFYVWPTVPME